MFWPFNKKSKQDEKKSKTLADESEKQTPKEQTSKAIKPEDIIRMARKDLAEQHYQRAEEAAYAAIEAMTPQLTVSVSKVGHEDHYHIYRFPSEEDVGKLAEVDLTYQYHDENDEKDREAYVVSVDGREYGELSERTIEKIESEIGDLHSSFFAVKSCTEGEDTESMKMRLSVYNNGSACAPGNRIWKIDLVGINYEGRAEILKEGGAGYCILEPTEYEGEPAVKVLDPLHREIGWVEKELAPEICQKIRTDKITSTRVDNIREQDGKTYANLFLLIRKF